MGSLDQKQLKEYTSLPLSTDLHMVAACCSLQFETEAEGGRLRRDVTAEGSVAPVGATRSERTSIKSIFSGGEEVFAFRRAVTHSSYFLLAFNYQLITLCFREAP